MGKFSIIIALHKTVLFGSCNNINVSTRYDDSFNFVKDSV